MRTNRKLVGAMIIGLTLGAGTLPVWELRAWGEHALASYPALKVLPEFRQAPKVRAESLEAFLRANEKELVTELASIEGELKKSMPEYPPLPAALAFRAGPPATLRARFLQAIRVNPRSVLPLYLQLLPGEKTTRPLLPPSRMIFLKHTGAYYAKTRFVSLRPGEVVSPLAVTATATDEPDFGLDVGLYKNNSTKFGKQYGFGEQPFGRPELEYGSQPPFHMGFYHEAGIVYALAGFLKRTLPEYRVYLYGRLARLAFRRGHDYWGYRFLGWALHYIQDLTQPYHARVLPGWSTPGMLWINLLYAVGVTGPRKDAVQLVSNRHLAIESYQRRLLVRLHEQGDSSHTVLRALTSDKNDQRHGVYDHRSIRSKITQAAAAYSGKLDDIILSALPARMVDDPSFELSGSTAEQQMLAKVAQGGKAAELDRALTQLLGAFGAHSRVYVRKILSDVKR